MDEESEISHVRRTLLIFAKREKLSLRELAKRISDDTAVDVSYSTVRRFLRNERDAQPDHSEAFRNFAKSVRKKDPVLVLGASLAALYPSRTRPPEILTSYATDHEVSRLSITSEGTYWRVEETTYMPAQLVFRGAMVWTGKAFFAVLFDTLVGDQKTCALELKAKALEGHCHYHSRLWPDQCKLLRFSPEQP